MDPIQNPVVEHFASVSGGQLFLITFVNNSKDPDEIEGFRIGKVIDWLRKVTISYFVVRERHKDLRSHFHALALIKYDTLKTSFFKYKYRGHIKLIVKGHYDIDRTFKELTVPENLTRFKYKIWTVARADKTIRQTPGRAGRHSTALAKSVGGYISKDILFANCHRYSDWSCSCKKDHIDIYFSKFFETSDILKYIKTFL